jgi:DNA topoisomerase II
MATASDGGDGGDGATAAPTQATEGGPRAIEDVYQKKSQLEHILLRPDTYVGSTERQVVRAWVHDGDGGGEGGSEDGSSGGGGSGGMVCRDIAYVPGLYKIFDEILVNAADNKVRDPSMDALRVDVDPATGWVRVWNNGAGVPVEIHKGEGVYVPELIFGHLLTSSNYNDAEQKVTGGRNGYGAKLANIFSTDFVVETCDGSRRRSYRQVRNER